MENTKRKTDRRTLYTCNAVKQAVLELLSEKDYDRITVTDICKRAEICRGTFYLHFDNISQIVDELIDDVLQQSTPLSEQLALQEPSKSRCSFPLCQLLRSQRRYRPLFLSDSLHGRVVQRLAAQRGDGFSDAIAQSGAYSARTFSALRVFQISGCLAACKENMLLSDAEWAEIQCSIDRLLQSGLQNT